MDVTIACVCPATDAGPRHPDGDTITLRDRLDFRGAVTIRQDVGLLARSRQKVRDAEVFALLIENYLRLGIGHWTLADEKGKPVPVNDATVEAFLEQHQPEAIEVGDAADVLYAEQVLLPLLRRASSSSPPTPTATVTSPTSGGRKRQKSPRPSSITPIPTAATAKTSSSRDGAGSTSQNSASAA